MSKREMMIHRDRVPAIEAGRLVMKTRERTVRVLARAEGWALVRQKGCATYACTEKELLPIAATIHLKEPT